MIYPLCVILPFVLALIVIDPSNPAAILPLGILSLFTAGTMEWLYPHSLQWRKSHGDILTDIVHQFLSLPLSLLLRAGLIYLFFTIIAEPAGWFAIITWPTHWPLWCQAVLGLVVSEFGTYWRHRIFHEWPIGWRFHSVHHLSLIHI